MDTGTAGLALSIATLNTLYELRLVTIEQARDTVDVAIRGIEVGEQAAARDLIKRTIPDFVR